MRRHAVGPSTTVTLAAHSLRPRVGPLTCPAACSPAGPPALVLSPGAAAALCRQCPATAAAALSTTRPAVVSADHIRAGLLARSRLLLAPPQPPAAPLLSPPPALSTLSACHVACRSFRSSPPSASTVRLVHLRPRSHRFASAVHQRLSHQALARHAPVLASRATALSPCPAVHALVCWFRVFSCAAGVRLAWQVLGSRPAAGTVLRACLKIFRFHTPLAKPSPNFFKGFISLGCWFSRTPGDSGKSEHTIRLAVVDLPNRCVVTFSRKSIFTFKCPHRNTHVWLSQFLILLLLASQKISLRFERERISANGEVPAVAETNARFL